MRNHQTTPLSIDRAPDGGIVIHALTADGVVPVGTYGNIAEAWRAVDELDAPHSLAAAA